VHGVVCALKQSKMGYIKDRTNLRILNTTEEVQVVL
jgi:hypothetical protein